MTKQLPLSVRSAEKRLRNEKLRDGIVRKDHIAVVLRRNRG
jgi:hypothetical protein